MCERKNTLFPASHAETNTTRHQLELMCDSWLRRTWFVTAFMIDACHFGTRIYLSAQHWSSHQWSGFRIPVASSPTAAADANTARRDSVGTKTRIRARNWSATEKTREKRRAKGECGTERRRRMTGQSCAQSGDGNRFAIEATLKHFLGWGKIMFNGINAVFCFLVVIIPLCYR